MNICTCNSLHVQYVALCMCFSCVQCVAVNDVTKRKQDIGYVLLDLKSAQQLIPPKVDTFMGGAR